MVLQAMVVKAKRDKQPSHPGIPAVFMSKVFPDLQQQRQPVQLKFTVDGQDSTPPGEAAEQALTCCQRQKTL
jgi:hypothetical protein